MKYFFKLICVSLLFVFSFCTDSVDFTSSYSEFNSIDSLFSKNLINTLSKEERKELLGSAYDKVLKMNGEQEKLNFLGKIASEYYKIGEYELFKELSQEINSLSFSLKDSVFLAKSYGYFGIYYRKKSRLDSAYQNFFKADKIYLALDRSKNIKPIIYSYDHGKVLIDMAQLSRKVKDYGESEDLTVRAIEKFESSENKSYLPLSYTNLGTVFKETERYSKAVAYYEKAIEKAKSTPKDTLYTILSYNNIGTVYKSQQEYELAKDYYRKALSFKPFLDRDRKRYARLLDNLAYVKFLSNPGDESVLKLFHDSRRIRDSVEDILGLSTNSIHLAEYYQFKSNDSVSRYYANKAYEYANKVDNNVELLQAYDILSNVSKSDVGLNYAKRYIKLNDSLLKQERLYKNKFARIKYETEQTEKELTEVSRQNEILVIAVLGLTALFLLIYIIFRQQQSNKELLFAQQQQSTNEEIYRLLLSQQVKLEEGRQLEQQRMSEELHDGVLGRLFGVRLSLDGINQRVNDGFTETRTKYIEELKSIEKEIRLISHDLGTETLSPEVAYIDSVESLISDLCEAHKMEFEFFNDENIDWEEIDDQKKVNLFRILQESMQNTFKHAKAKKIKISFEYVDDNINLLILDDGIGFKSNKVKRGIGLKNITSRVSQMSGVVDFISNKDAGTKVSVKIPA